MWRNRVAQQTSVTMVDDLDGGKAAETVTFGLDGGSYEIDLSKKNAGALRKALTEFVEHGRRAKFGSPVASGRNQKRPVPTYRPQPRGCAGVGRQPGHRCVAPRPDLC